MSLDITLFDEIDSAERVVFEYNITHNVSAMAELAGIYGVIWHPADNGIAIAGDLTDPLQKGLAQLQRNPVRFRALEPSNCWGTYEDLVQFVIIYLAASVEHRFARVRADR